MLCNVTNFECIVGSEAISRTLDLTGTCALRAAAALIRAVPLALRDWVYYRIASRRHGLFGTSRCAFTSDDFDTRMIRSSHDL